ncbi:MAG: response regulator [Methylomonas sp.]|nr:response regulator [Methylomonas sp.]
MSNSSDAATVYVVDDDPSVLQAVGRLIRSAGWDVASFGSAREFFDRPPCHAPGCVVLDVTMPEMNGLEVQQALIAAGDSLPVIFLTGNGDIPMSVRAMKSGAVDFLSKPCNDETLIAAIQEALALSRQAHEARVATQSVRELLATLTPREFEVMQGVVAGRLNKQIGAELLITEKTVKVHRARMLEKLRVSSVPDLVRLVERVGIAS